MKQLFIFCLVSLLGGFVQAQELNVKVSVSAPRLQTADPKVFESLETAIHVVFVREPSSLVSPSFH